MSALRLSPGSFYRGRHGRPSRIEPKEPASKAVATALGGAAGRLRKAAPAAGDGRVKGVHKVRVSCRRLRSELRAFRELVDRDWREKLEAELKWLGGALGDVRDLDILKQRLLVAASGSDAEGVEDLTDRLQPLFEWLDQRRESAAETMRQALRSERFGGLSASLQEAIYAPPLRKRSRRSCRKVLPPLVESVWRSFRRDARALGLDSPDEQFHDVRKRAKRTRYTAELIAPTLGRTAERGSSRFIQLTKSVQDVLGEHQDMTVAIAEVGCFLSQHAGEPDLNQAVDALLSRLRRDADASRDAFFDIWRKLDRKRLRRWLKK